MRKPTSAVVNEKTNTMYVTDFFAGKIHIINGDTDEAIESIQEDLLSVK